MLHSDVIMRVVSALIAICLAVPAAAQKSDREIEAYLPKLLEPPVRFMNIEPAEGAYLRSQVVRLKARRVLEIGTSNGYSAVWIAMGLRRTGGRLITLESDRERHALAVRTLRDTGLDGIVEARLADALVETRKVGGPLDFTFIDAWKPDYLAYYEMVLPKMRKGGIIAAHNVVSHPRDLAEFLQRVTTDPRVKTEIVTPGRAGFSISVVQD